MERISEIDADGIVGVIAPDGNCEFYQVIWYKKGVLTATGLYRNELNEGLRWLYSPARSLNTKMVDSVKLLVRSLRHGANREHAK